MLLDLYTLINPPLSVVDGITAMEGKGPGFGNPRDLGLIISGTDAVAVDAVIAAILGAQPEHCPTIHSALTNHYGTAHLDDIEIRGEQITDVLVDDFKFPPLITPPGTIRRILMSVLKGPLTTSPFIDKNQCQRCGNCFKACPVNCIISRENDFEIKRDECIQCLCCMEVCPNGAVDLKDGFLLTLFKRKK
jgi:ferredoxin